MSQQFNLHPEYGLTDEFRARVLKYQDLTGESNRKVAAEFRISECAIRKWRKALVEEKME